LKDGLDYFKSLLIFMEVVICDRD